jgi:hypothetical protein
MRETSFKGYDAFQIFDLSWGKCDAESLDILHEMFNFPTTDDREDVWSFVHHVRNSD